MIRKNSYDDRHVTGSIQVKNGYRYISLNLYRQGKRQPKLINTGLRENLNNKQKAKMLLNVALHMINFEKKSLEQVIGAVAGDGFKKKLPIDPALNKNKNVIEFIQPEVLEEMKALLPPRKGSGVFRLWNIAVGEKDEHIQVGDYLKSWLIREKHYVKSTTYENYRSNMELRVIPYFEQFDITLSELKAQDIQTFYDYCMSVSRLDGRQGEISLTTLRRIHACTHKALNDAVRLGLIPSNPVSSLRAPRENEYNVTYYTPTQITKFLNTARGDSCEVPLVLAFYYGLRRSEALGVKISAVDFDENIINIRHTVVLCDGIVLKQNLAKTKKSYRSLPLTPEIRFFLMQHVRKLAEQKTIFGGSWNSEGYLCVYDDGSLIHPNTLSKHYKRITQKAKLPANRLHDARHSNASLLIRSGRSMKEVQEWLGHSDISITGRYAHLGIDDKKEVANIISGKLNLILL